MKENDDDKLLVLVFDIFCEFYLILLLNKQLYNNDMSILPKFCKSCDNKSLDLLYTNKNVNFRAPATEGGGSLTSGTKALKYRIPLRNTCGGLGFREN